MFWLIECLITWCNNNHLMIRQPETWKHNANGYSHHKACPLVPFQLRGCIQYLHFITWKAFYFYIFCSINEAIPFYFCARPFQHNRLKTIQWARKSRARPWGILSQMHCPLRSQTQYWKPKRVNSFFRSNLKWSVPSIRFYVLFNIIWIYKWVHQILAWYYSYEEQATADSCQSVWNMK